MFPSHIQAMIDTITDQYDASQQESFESGDYDYLLSGHEVDVKACLANFEANYRAATIGLQEFDDLEASEIRRLLGDDLLWSLIVDTSKTLAIHDFYIQWNEINSFHIGEFHHEIDVSSHPDLEAALRAEGIPDESLTAYGLPCERLILKLDPKAFLASAERHLLTAINRQSIKLVRA